MCDVMVDRRQFSTEVIIKLQLKFMEFLGHMTSVAVFIVFIQFPLPIKPLE